MISANAEIKDQALAGGAKAFLEKPNLFNLEQIIKELTCDRAPHPSCFDTVNKIVSKGSFLKTKIDKKLSRHASL
jgi:hypothetical protein